MCGGGGFFGGISDAFEDVAGGIADLGQGAIDTVSSLGSQIDDTVNQIPGGWGTVAAATGVYFSPEIGAYLNSAGNPITEAEVLSAAQETAATGGGGVADLISGGTDWSNPANWDVTGLGDTGSGLPFDYGVGADMGEGIAADYVPDYGVGADMGEGIAADYTGETDWTDPSNWDTAGLGAVGMGGADTTGLAGLAGAAGAAGSGANKLSKFLNSPLFGNLTGGGALLGAAGLYKLIDMMKEDNKRFGTPGRQDYTGGALSKFKYDPASFTPTRVDPSMFRPTTIRTLNQDMLAPQPQRAVADTFQPQVSPVPRVADEVRPALGGGLSGIGNLIRDNEGPRPIDYPEAGQPISPVIQQVNDQMLSAGLGGIGRLFGFAEGGKTQRPQLTSKAKMAAMDPYLRAMAQLNNAAYNARMPAGMQAPAGAVSQLGQFQLASGGMSNLGDYSDGGRLLRGPGDGVSDSIPATIGNKQPARLADGEFVVPARIVSELGNGSTDAGARKLYAMMDRIQKARGNTTGKGKVAKNTRADKYLPA